MKMYKTLPILFLGLLFASCTKELADINTDPNSNRSLDASFLFSNAQFTTHVALMENEATIVQQFVNPFGGVTAAFNFNILNQVFTPQRWNNTYPNSIKLLTQLISQVKDNPARVNIYNEARILRAYQFMTLVDTYGDVPYSEAGLAYLEKKYFPKYDNQQAIYTDLVKELTEASAALDPTKDIVTSDIFYTGRVAQWKKLGYSLLLRIGMRYSKVDEGKAKSIVQAAVAGGVMDSNADDCYIKFTPAYTNPVTTGNQVLTNTYYLAAPFITQLKSSRDPRLKYISAIYTDPGNAANLPGDTASAKQFGLPVGYDSGTLPTAPGYRGSVGSGFNYSQVNYKIIGKQTAPLFLVTNAQTQLLLAEAAVRGWITGDPAAFYRKGVAADMERYTLYDASAVISVDEQNSFLRFPQNLYNTTDALRLINTQYWIASYYNGNEAWSNFRRSGFPALSPNTYPGRQIKGTFVRRFTYPQSEASVNATNYRAAVASNGGPDDLDTRIFWDKP